jgi:hypothetical protein
LFPTLLAVATEVWSLLVPMKLGHLVFVLQYLSKWRYASVTAKVMKGDMELSLLSMIYPSHRRKAPIVEKASIDELSECTGMDRFHGCYQWTNELSQSITKKQDCR